MSSICKRVWWRFCHRSGSPPASIRWESSGSRGGARSAVAPDFWRVFWVRQLPAGGGWMPARALDRKEFIAGLGGGGNLSSRSVVNTLRSEIFSTTFSRLQLRFARPTRLLYRKQFQILHL